MKAFGNNFDFLRLSLAVSVIFSHSYLLTGREDQEPLARLTLNSYTIGHLAVDGFFIISGFLLTQSWIRNPHLGSYLKNRILRIYPGFIVVCLFCYLVVGPLGSDSAVAYFYGLSLRRIFLRLAFLMTLNAPATLMHVPHVNAVNGSLWTISYEFYCYLALAFFGCLGIIRHRLRVLGVFVAIYAIHFCFASGVASAGFFPPSKTAGGEFFELLDPSMLFQQFSFFFSGSVLFHWRQYITPKVCLACAGLLGVVFLGARIPVLFTPLLVGPIILWLALAPVKLPKLAAHGDFSYGTYLYAYPVQQLLVMAGITGVGMLILCALPIIALLAALSWFLVERPALRLKSTTTPLRVPQPVSA